jgi:hypothetical protein
MLGGAYEITSHEPMTRLCPQSLCREAPGRGSGGLRNFLSDAAVVLGHVLLPPHMARTVLPPIDRGWNAFAGNEPLSESSTRPKGSDAGKGRPELAVRVTSHRRALYALHFMLPHVPWHFLPTGQQYDRRNPIPGLGLGERWTSDSEEVAQAYQRHLLQVGYVDYVLGDVLGKLEAAGVYDKAMLIVVADHGCTFRAGESRRLLTESTWSDILRIPLLVKLPAQNHGVVSDRPVQTIDIVPTIAEVLGVSIPFPVDGQSILSNDARSREPGAAFNYFFTRFDVPEDLSGLQEAVRRKAELFGVGVDTRKLFGRGPAWQLVGDRVDGLRVSQADNITAVLTEPERFTDVRPNAGFIPALVSGRLSGPSITAQHTGIALAINGVIRAIAPVRRSGDGADFQAVVPGASFRPGLNDVAIFVVDSTTADVTIRRVRLRKGGYRLVSHRGTERIDSGFGRSVIVRPDAVRGFVEEASRTNLQDYLSIGGWLVDPNRAGPPAVLVFADNRLVGTAVATIDRPDVAKSLGDVEALRSGYVIRISLSELVGVRNVRLFGISANGAASELHYPPDFPYRSLTSDYRLTSDQKGERVESSAGQPVAVQAGAVNGYVDHWSRTQSGDVLISGWAADRSDPGLTTVLVFANERLVAGVRSTIPRPDVADHFKDRRLLRSGYEAFIPRSDLEGAPRIRVFGLSARGVASELAYTADALQSKR